MHVCLKEMHCYDGCGGLLCFCITRRERIEATFPFVGGACCIDRDGRCVLDGIRCTLFSTFVLFSYFLQSFESP